MKAIRKNVTVLNVIRMLCIFVISYCVVDVVMLFMLIAPRHTENILIFYKYGMTLPAAICIGLNATWTFMLASIQRNVALHFNHCVNFEERMKP